MHIKTIILAFLTVPKVIMKILLLEFAKVVLIKNAKNVQTNLKMVAHFANKVLIYNINNFLYYYFLTNSLTTKTF